MNVYQETRRVALTVRQVTGLVTGPKGNMTGVHAHHTANSPAIFTTGGLSCVLPQVCPIWPPGASGRATRSAATPITAPFLFWQDSYCRK
ncbi:hypothetical protein E2C01_039078 [Portunus trituberculatus]|uniref:Uncharacterized protein n=1 Tax=Portunus trituberculatus TaxID=210409 RepID=A0A5B7FCN3_PORTR|nr:hypothetical protein [Portunus trituberculatus]